MATKLVYDFETGETTEVEMVGDELAAHEKMVSDAATQAASAQAETRFAGDTDAERLALVRERAETDPAFAALAELALGGKGL